MQIAKMQRFLYSAALFATIFLCIPASAELSTGADAGNSAHGNLVAWPREGSYTTAFFRLVNGSPACVLLMSPRRESEETSYDVSVWRQSESLHFWLVRHGAALPNVSELHLASSDGPEVNLAITKHLQPSQGSDAVMADISQQELNRSLLTNAQNGSESYVEIERKRYLIPAEGLRQAIEHLVECSTRL